MEKVQKRALKIVYSDYDSSYNDLRVKSKRPLMYTQRLRSILSEMHKIYHGFSPEYMKDFVKKSDCIYITRNTKRVELPVCRTVRYGYNSFKYNGASLWNGLSYTIKQESDLCTFRKLLSEWNGLKCSCSACKLCSLKYM